MKGKIHIRSDLISYESYLIDLFVDELRGKSMEILLAIAMTYGLTVVEEDKM